MSDEGPDNDLLAAEYVLGVLPPDQARALEALALHDPAVAESIAAWQNRLAPLAELVESIVPPDLLWRRLALATGVDATPTRGPARTRPTRNPLRGRLNFWRGAALAGLAVAASLAFLLLSPAPQPPGLLAALSPAGVPAPAFLIRVAPGGQAVVLALDTARPPSGRSFELWELRQGAAAPVSLGVLPIIGQRQFVLDAPPGTRLLVSQEPPGGSPTGQPTGPVVFSGTLGGA